MGAEIPTKIRILRPYVTDVIYKFLDCGDPYMGFAVVKCDDCKHEYILPFLVRGGIFVRLPSETSHRVR